MDKPSYIYPSVPTSTISPMPVYLPDTSISTASFDQLLQQRGIRFIHKKAVKCPNVKHEEGRGHEPECQFCDNSGFIYFSEKEIFGVFESNSLEKLFEIQGTWEEGTAVLTFPTTYPDGTQCDFCQFDKLLIPDFQVRLYELRVYEKTASNAQRLRYPVLGLDYAALVEGGRLRSLAAGVDLNVSNGKIEWIAGKEPTVDAYTNSGPVITYSYLANPEFNVVRMMHELRATQEMSGGTKRPARLPQQILVKRDSLGSSEVLGT